MKKIKKLSIPNDARVIVISDIHGELNLLKEALEKNVITENSYYYLKDKIIKEYKIF